MIDILRDDQTRVYELTYLLTPTLTESEATAAKKAVDALVAKFGGKMVKTEDWGKRELAYKIRHSGQRQGEAYYTHLVIEFEPRKAFEFEKELYLQDEIMRHLVVLSDVQGNEEVKVSATEEKK
jgi:small subunit ribosomal protein S6